MTAQDIPAGMGLCTSAGWNQLEEDWRFFLESPGSGAFLAQTADRTVGTAAFVRYGGFAWIAMMLVAPDQRRMGIGGGLFETVLEAVRDVPCVGLDATALGEPVYRRRGFVNDYTLVRTKATVEAARFLPFAGGARPMSTADMPAVFARDLAVFGADRSALLSSFYARAPECAWIVPGDDGVRGYTFGRPGRLFSQLGPSVADDAATARELVAGCFARLDGRYFTIDAPQLDTDWLNWLAGVGFQVERPFVRMFREGSRHPGEPPRQYAITGPEFA
jgi:GNAT superfamily N-acetyltransferase